MDLYYHKISPPCWAVLLLGRELNLEFNLKEISMSPNDPLRPTFLKLNPQHQVPTVADGDFGLGESRAIMRYLVAAYSGSDDHPLYPKDAKARAVIDSRLDFDLGMLYRREYDYYEPMWKNQTEGTEANRSKLCEALGFLEEFLSRSRYVAGDRLTIADVSLVVSISLLYVCSFDLEAFPKIVAWYDVCKNELKGYHELVGSQFEGLRKWMTKG